MGGFIYVCTHCIMHVFYSINTVSFKMCMHTHRYYVQTVLPKPSAAATRVVKAGDILELAHTYIHIYIHTHRYYVQTVLPNTSAAATGVVKAGDILELVNNESVVGKSLQDLRNMILGPAGMYVYISVCMWIHVYG